jgi:predicted nucleotidyltransferase
MMAFGLSNTQHEQINSIFSNYPQIESVLIYGSRAKGTHKPYSDIDLTIVGENINLTILQKIELELDDLMLPYKFDISEFKSIENKELLEHISRIGKVFYKTKN